MAPQEPKEEEDLGHEGESSDEQGLINQEAIDEIDTLTVDERKQYYNFLSYSIKLTGAVSVIELVYNYFKDWENYYFTDFYYHAIWLVLCTLVLYLTTFTVERVERSRAGRKRRQNKCQ
jgi:hypothetical protein